MSKSDFIKEFVASVTGVSDIDVEIVEDTVVLSREERWHIYVIKDRFTMIGCFIDDDIELSDIIRKNAAKILYIYENAGGEE